MNYIMALTLLLDLVLTLLSFPSPESKLLVIILGLRSSLSQNNS